MLNEIISTRSLPDYDATEVLWATFTTVVNLTNDAGKNVPEHDRQGLESLIEKFSEDEMQRLLKDVSVDSLVFLDPPLETVLTGPEGTADEVSTMRAIGTLRSSRDSDPKEALINLVKVLERICAHVLKEVPVAFDKEILSLTRKILYLLCILAVSKLKTDMYPDLQRKTRETDALK
ncbi:hypothetical protein S225a_04410 [Candidatus Brocadiaceae bacterium S225]|uniref:Uncharacterized protein n=1 Tax=Candidatus Scalindua brodae TaxID=237368 RepID=A0A0B0EKV6_9BACT|nr:MAG: hypothetical protein SCABRO_02990 [Candidatus Scalindua brodae]TWU36944.1 hypothetical protein S225a_04410 [Candidatus Brocadiaceae bacterium S225]